MDPGARFGVIPASIMSIWFSRPLTAILPTIAHLSFLSSFFEQIVLPTWVLRPCPLLFFSSFSYLLTITLIVLLPLFLYHCHISFILSLVFFIVLTGGNKRYCYYYCFWKLNNVEFCRGNSSYLPSLWFISGGLAAQGRKQIVFPPRKVSSVQDWFWRAISCGPPIRESATRKGSQMAFYKNALLRRS